MRRSSTMRPPWITTVRFLHCDLVEQMSGPQHGHAVVAALRAHPFDDCPPARHIEPHRGLVEQQEPRPMQQAASDLDPSALAARERTHELPATRQQPETRQLRVDARLRVVAGEAMQGGVISQRPGPPSSRDRAPAPGKQSHFTCQRIPAFVRQAVSEDRDRAGLKVQQSRDQRKQRGLARAVARPQGARTNSPQAADRVTSSRALLR